MVLLQGQKIRVEEKQVESNTLHFFLSLGSVLSKS